MKKLSIFSGIVLVLALMAGPAYAVSFGLDIDQDGIVDDPAEVTRYESDTVAIDVYLVEWDAVTYDNVASILMWFEWDTGSISLSSYSCTDPAWDYTAFDASISGKLELSHLNSTAGFPGPDVYLGTVVLHCIDAPSTSEIKATLGAGVVMLTTGIGFFSVTDGKGIIHQLGCVQDADCDDGVFCNGKEICVDGACEQGTDPCPDQVCDEYTSSCESTLTTTTIIKTISDDNRRSIFNEIPESSDDNTRSVLNEMSGSSDITTTITYGPTTTQKTSNLTTITESITESVKAPESITRISPKINTTTLSSPYRVFISPSSVTINSGEMVQFRSKTIFDENGLKGKYRWKIDPASSIGSTIDENGILTAGINTADSAMQETVWVTDIIHENTYATGTVTIPGKKQLPLGCELSTSPSAATILSEDTIKIFAKNFGRKCLKGSYEWKIYSKIGSQISADGLYTAGNNDTGNSAIDIIIVKDIANNSSADSIITVLPSEKVARVAPDSTEKPQPEAVSRRGTYSKVLIVIIPITLLVIVTIGIVLFRKIKQ